MKHKLLLIYAWFIRTILFFLPDIPFIMSFRGFMYGLAMKKCGKDFQVTHDANLKVLQEISIGNHVFIGNATVLLAGGGIMIEDNVLIGPHCILVSGNHSFENGSYRFGKSILGEIIIKHGSWVGGNCTVTKSSILPPFSVLGANSLLNKQFIESNALYAGVPAKLVKCDLNVIEK